MWKEVVVVYFQVNFNEGLRKTTSDFSHNSKSSDRKFTPRPLEYKAGFLLARQIGKLCTSWQGI